jgi:hypothetical protein
VNAHAAIAACCAMVGALHHRHRDPVRLALRWEALSREASVARRARTSARGHLGPNVVYS